MDTAAYSNGYFKIDVQKWVFENFGENSKILDVGAGSGTYWKLLHNKFKNIDAVEIHEGNIIDYQLKEKYANVYNCNILDFEYEWYDLIIFGDILEHLTVEDAYKVLTYAIDRSKNVIVALPYCYKSGPHPENKYEEHIQDDLTIENIKERYPMLRLLYGNDDYGYYINNNNIKTAVCCIVKNENEYLREFVEYYKDLGFTNIILYDNNDSNGEDIYDVINDYIESGFVIQIDIKDKEKMQFDSYNSCLKNFGLLYDWIAFLDCDEYLCLNNVKTIDEYLISFDNNVDCVCINWMMMTDNSMIDNDGRKLIERFTEAAYKFSYVPSYENIYVNSHIKSIIKCPSNAYFKNPHFAFNCKNYANADGEIINEYMPNWNINNKIFWDNAYIKHFSSKTINEYLNNKIQKGFADVVNKPYTYNEISDLCKRFFWYNKHTLEKDEIVKKYLETKHMKSLLILVMSCQDDFFVKEEEILKETWAKPIIDGEYKNIDIIIYRGGYDENSYSNKTKVLKLHIEDGMPYTFKKTYMALNMIWNEFREYDYVFRTNTSTYVNVPLMNELIQRMEDDTVAYFSDIYSLSEQCAPYPLCLGGRGNGMLLSNKLVNIILKEGLPWIYLTHAMHSSDGTAHIPDDSTISMILNSHWIMNGEEYKDHIKGLRHGWYNCISSEAHNNHSVCNYFEKSQDPEFWKNIVTIQMKCYREREREYDNYKEFHEIISKASDIDNDTIELNENYYNNFDVFIGSILGYAPYDEWKATNKFQLYDLEIHHKASDDEQRYKTKLPFIYVKYNQNKDFSI